MPSPFSPLPPSPQTSAKVTDPARLEEIRETIIRNMLEYHPEAAQAGLSAFVTAKRAVEKSDSPLGASSKTIQTRIYCKPVAAGTRSELFIVTRDRPGLLVDICRVLADCSLNVLSASINTEGDAANDLFFVTYRGKALEGPMASAPGPRPAPRPAAAPGRKPGPASRPTLVATSLAARAQPLRVSARVRQVELVTNALTYYLTLADIESTESY